jgi:putative aminopeptidase FrvX
MPEAAFDPAAITADAVALAELHGGTGHERVRIDWLQRRLEQAPGSRYVDGAGNLVWTFGPPLTTADGSTDANAALAAGIPAVALGCCQGEDMHAPTERIRADSIATGAAQLRAVLAEVLEPYANPRN